MKKENQKAKKQKIKKGRIGRGGRGGAGGRSGQKIKQDVNINITPDRYQAYHPFVSSSLQSQKLGEENTIKRLTDLINKSLIPQSNLPIFENNNSQRINIERKPDLSNKTLLENINTALIQDQELRVNRPQLEEKAQEVNQNDLAFEQPQQVQEEISYIEPDLNNIDTITKLGKKEPLLKDTIGSFKIIGENKIYWNETSNTPAKKLFDPKKLIKANEQDKQQLDLALISQVGKKEAEQLAKQPTRKKKSVEI